MSVAPAVRQEIPFLGLHFYDEEHQHLFFGRDEQLRDLLATLAESRFVTVIGSSGTGKSSLVRAGLIPALRSGFLSGAGKHWQIVKMHPGTAPIRNLATEIEHVFSASGLEITLRRGPLGLVEAARQSALGANENLLVVVDQFEEIFRYQRDAADRQGAAEEASCFVKLLLEATSRVEPAIFVLITMRSDYLGACAQFRDLPERINTGLYLIPRMRRDQLEEAICGPAAIAGAAFSPALVQRLLNDAGEDPDQLPVLQHVLLRTWLNWKVEGKLDQPIDFRHYEATGGVHNGLDNHAEEIYKGLEPGEQKIAEVLFRCLTERDPSNNDIRRPTQLNAIAAIAGVPADAVRQVAEKFRAEGVSFLTPTPPAKLDGDTLLDITHESLIRKWSRLHGAREQKGWVQDEAELREQYLALVKRARRNLPLSRNELNDASKWSSRNLNRDWAIRYDPAPDAYDLVQNYIRRERMRRHAYGALIIAVLLAVLGISLHIKHRFDTAAKEAKDRLDQAQADALKHLQEDHARLKQDYDTQAGQLEQQKELAEGNEKHATEFQKLATARQLASQADALKDRDSRVELNALLALESLNQHPLPEGISALRSPLALLPKPLWAKSLMPTNNTLKIAPDFEIGKPRLQFNSDGRYVARLNPDSSLHIYSARTGDEIQFTPINQQEQIIALAWAGNELRVLTQNTSESAEVVPISVFAININGKEPQKINYFKCDFEGGERCELTSDGKYLLVTSAEGIGYLRPLPEGDDLPIAQGGKIYAVGPAGRLILREILRGDGKPSGLGVFNRQTTQTARIEGDGSLPLDLSGSADYFATVGQDRVVRVYRQDQIPVSRPDQKAVQLDPVGRIISSSTPSTIALSPNGQLLAIGDEFGDLKVFDWQPGRKRAAWSHSSAITAIIFSPDSQSIASVDRGNELRLVSLQNSGATGNKSPGAQSGWPAISLGTSSEHSAYSASFDPSEQYVLLSSRQSAQIFNASTGRPVVLQGKTTFSTATAISSDGRYAATVSPQGPLVADLVSGVATTVPQPFSRVSSLVVSPEGKYVALVSSSGVNRAGKPLPAKIGIINLTTQKPVTLPQALQSVTGSPIFSPDGNWLFIHSDQGFALLRCGSWSTHVFRGRGVTAPTFSPDSRFLFVVSDELSPEQVWYTSAKLVDLQSPSLETKRLNLGEDTPATLVQFSRDHHLAIASNNAEDASLRIFDPILGKPLATLSLQLPVLSMSFSKSSQYLAVEFSNQAVSVFDLRRGLEVSRIGLEPNELLLAFHFSPDDRSLVFVSTYAFSEEESLFSEHEILIKQQYLFPADLIREGCSRVSRNLTAIEWKTYLPDYQCRATCPNLPNLCNQK